jgi:hypothetical protein
VAKRKIPTIDDRINALRTSLIDRIGDVEKRTNRTDERIEALAESLELVLFAQLDTEREIMRLARLATSIITNHEKRIAKLEGGK